MGIDFGRLGRSRLFIGRAEREMLPAFLIGKSAGVFL
jgi:hypothetical protein